MLKLSQIFGFENDVAALRKLTTNNTTEIKNYEADIKAYVNGAELNDIDAKPSMAIIRKQGRNISYIIHNT